MFFSSSEAENCITIEHRMGRSDRPGQSILGHLGDFLGLGFGENRIGGHHADGGILRRGRWLGFRDLDGTLPLRTKLSIDFQPDFPWPAAFRIDH